MPRKPKEEDAPPVDAGFEGFETPTENWSKLPHMLIAALPRIKSVSELKVILYVLRHTWGFQEFDEGKKITADEFMHGRKRRDGTRLDHGTGLTKPSIIDGCRRAVADGFMVVEIDTHDLARVEKYYMLHMKADRGSKVFTPNTESGVKTFYPGGKTFDPRGKEFLPRSEKETLKETEERKDQQAPSLEHGDPERARLAGIWQEISDDISARFGWTRALPLRQFQLVAGKGGRVQLLYPEELEQTYFRDALRQFIASRLAERLGQAVDLRAV